LGTAWARGTARERQIERQGPPAATCAPRLTIAADAATVGALLRRADAGTRERLVGTLQRLHGNDALQRLFAPPDALPVQRWRVGLPRRTTDCDRIIDYVSTNSPYGTTSGAARTNARFRWHGTPTHSDAGDALTATVHNPRVTKKVTVDLPRWSPTDPAISAAWSAAMADLRAHEARHEAIAETWEATLLGRLTALSVPLADRRAGTFTAAVQAEWDGWIADHLAAQEAIDPYWTTFTCPAPSEEAEAEPAPG
jgi:hypothetical protein